MITRQRHEDVVELRLDHGKVNALDIELLRAITQAFQDEAQDDATAAVVLTGAGRAFSAGVDLRRILEGGAAYVRAFLPALVDAFLAVYTIDKPVVAAVNGHAIAGGCVLAAACDRRLMAGGRIGVSELLVGVPFPIGALEVLRATVGTARASDLVLTGGLHGPDDARAVGLIDEVVDPEELLDRALAEARRLAAIPAATFRHTKRQLREPHIAAIDRLAPQDDPEVARIWASDDAARTIADFMTQTVGRG